MTRNLISVVTIMLICFSVTESQAEKPQVEKKTFVRKQEPKLIRFNCDKRAQLSAVDTSKYGDITQEYQLLGEKLIQPPPAAVSFEVLCQEKLLGFQKIPDKRKALKMSKLFLIDYIKLGRSPMNGWLFGDIRITRLMSSLKRVGRKKDYQKIRKYRTLYAEMKTQFDRALQKALDAQVNDELNDKGTGYKERGYLKACTAECYQKIQKFEQEESINVKLMLNHISDSVFLTNFYAKTLSDLSIDFYLKHFPNMKKEIQRQKDISKMRSRYQELILVLEERQSQTILKYHYSGKIVDKQDHPIPGVFIMLSRRKTPQNSADKEKLEITSTLNQPNGTFDCIVEVPYENQELRNNDRTQMDFVKRDLLTGQWYAESNEMGKSKIQHGKTRTKKDCKNHAIFHRGLVSFTDKELAQLQSKWLKTSKPEIVFKRHHIKIVMKKNSASCWIVIRMQADGTRNVESYDWFALSPRLTYQQYKKEENQ